MNGDEEIMRRLNALAVTLMIFSGCDGGGSSSSTTTADQSATTQPITRPTTAPFSLTEDEQQFVDKAKDLGVQLLPKDLVPIGTNACDLAGDKGRLHSYIVESIEPASDAAGLVAYGKILTAAATHLCPGHAPVLTAEAERLSATTTPPAPRPASTPSTRSGPILGTRSAPLALGSEAVLSNGWRLSVQGVTPDATDEVMAENRFNDPPEEGHQFFIVNVSATYAGREDSALPLGDFSFSVVGSGNTQIREGCGVTPDKFDFYAEVFAGGSLSGNICFAVPSVATDSLVLYADAGVLNDQRAFFALS
ncbi:MAG TPA: hypothetical protein VNA57_07010 [Acidimicrobiales bacterium]|nr:hypothetical protein [Acidimicrobiales bacterium]